MLLLLLTLAGTGSVWATDIPLAVGTYLTTSESVTTGTINNNDKGNLGGIYKDATATFTLNNASAQEMVLYFLTGNNNSSSPQVTVTLNDGSSDIFNETVDIESTGGWDPVTKHIFDLGTVPAGTYSLKFAFTNTSGYVCNLGSIGIYNKTAFVSTIDAIPGDITLTNGVYNGPKTENSGANVGYVQNGGKAAYTFYNNTEGSYDLKLDIYRYNQGGTMNVKIVDLGTGEEDYSSNYTIASDAPAAYTTNTITIPNIKKGYKTMTFTFSDGSSYICNYKNVLFEYKGVAAEFSAYTIAGQTVTTGSDTDYLCSLPVSYGATTTFAISATNGTIAVTAKAEDDSDVAVTDNGDGTYTIPTPGLNSFTIVTTTLTPNPGAAAAKATCTLKIFHIGEMSLTAVTVDGTAIDVLTDINDSPYSATYDGCYTTAPVVAATQIDGAAATVDAPAISGSTYTYTIHGSMAGGTITRDYTLVLNNVHVYEATGDEESVNIKNNEGSREGNVWSNGIYTLSTTSLDGYNEFFKMNGDNYTISLPSDVVVKQLIFKDCSNNYAGNNARLLSVASTGATAYIPVDNKYYHESEGAKHDIIVNIDGHTAGTDITFNQPKSGQPMAWIQLTTVKQDPGTAPVKTAEEVNVVKNHAVVTLTFDREIPNDVTATINGGTVTAEGGSAVLTFPVWGLAYSTNYTLIIAAGAVTDSYGNSNTAAIEVAVNTSAKPAVTAATYDYVVSNASELDAALEELKESNKTAGAAHKTVFLKNGTYSYGTLEGAYQNNVSLKIDNWNNVYNVSLIGESKDGVVIEGTTDGITSSTLNLGNGTGIYVQDMTIRNNYDFPKENRFKGVSVAVTGGNKAVLKNVAMQACQDTYVTGKRTYLENCDIYGTVDFICGGGDIFFNQCDLILVDRGGDVIVAPNTTADTKWGYVFQHCTVKAEEGATDVVDKGWDLGRPWQNEPRAYYLNTTMEVLPTDNGWRGMGNLNTYFYEYNSMDKNGNALDLSVRGNSPTSLNHYTPVLTDEEAAKFTVENVLGGTDSWLPTEQTAQCVAPTLSREGTTLSWTAVDDAMCYVIFKDGQYLTNQTTTTLEGIEKGAYTVRAANEMGGLGAESNTIAYADVTLDENSDYTPVAQTDVDVVLLRTIYADKWSTIVLPCTVDDVETVFGTGTQAARFTGFADDKLQFTSVTTMNANEPYLIKVTKAVTAVTIENVDIALGTPDKSIGQVDFIGSYDATTDIPASDASNSYYFLAGNKLYKTKSTGAANTMKGFRAYFKVSGAATANELTFIIDDETTEISSVATQSQHTMAVYDLQGRRVAQPQKGLYIVNGKKVIIK